MKKGILIVVLLIAVLAAGLGFFWPFGRQRTLTLPGVVEIQDVRVGSKIGGRVARLLVEEGQRVSPGQDLVVFESPELQNQLAQMKAKLAAVEAELAKALEGPRVEEKNAARAAVASAKARVARLVAGWRDEEKRQFESELQAAKAEYDHTTRDMERIIQLLRDKSAAKADFDLARAAKDKSFAQMQVAQAKVDMVTVGSRKEDIAEAEAELSRNKAKLDELIAGTRKEDIDLARANVAGAKSKLDEIEINLREMVVRVPATPEFQEALVEVISVRPGDLVPANATVLRLLCQKDLWVEVFVSAAKLGLVDVGKQVDVTTDIPGKKYKGVVSFIERTSEFTPRNVQSIDERAFQVFRVKVRIQDSQDGIHSGMAAEVSVPLPDK